MMKADYYDVDQQRRSIKQALDPNIIRSLPYDMVVQVLSRLPAISIFRFRSVCKTWLTLISSPDFINIYLVHTKINHPNKDNEYLMINDSFVSHLTNDLVSRISLVNIGNSKNTLSLTSNHELLSKMDLFGSINGLVCLGGNYFSLKYIVLWNPVTDQFKNVACPATKHDSDYNMNLGFGFDSKTNDYIVVNVQRVFRDWEYFTKAELYSLNSDSWREIEQEAGFQLVSSTCETIVNGEPYWWACKRDNNPWFVVRFDVSDRKFKRVSMIGYIDPPITEKPKFIRLVNYDGSLGVIIDSTITLWRLPGKCLILGSPEPETSKRTMNMVLLDNEGSLPVGLKFCFPEEIERVIGCLKRGRLVLEDNSRKIVLFDRNTNEIQSTNIVGKGFRSYIVSDYVPSFVPVRGSERAMRHKAMKREFRQIEGEEQLLSVEKLVA